MNFIIKNEKKTLIQHFIFFKESITNQLAKYDVIKYLLKVLVNFKSDAVVCAYTCKAIWSLCVHESITRTLTGKNCLQRIREVLINHQTDSFCVEMACNTVLGLCTNGKYIQLDLVGELKIKYAFLNF